MSDSNNTTLNLKVKIVNTTYIMIWLVLLVVVCVSDVDAKQLKKENRPNVIIIYSDDQGIGDLGIYGGENIHTPHTDALAKKGVRFTQMYAPSSICSPSRAGLLTGRYPRRAGMLGNASPPPYRSINDEKGYPGLSSNQPTIGKIMRDAGYRTAMIGKWHLGYNPGNRPDDHGFDFWFGHIGGAIDNYSHYFHWNGPTRQDLWKNGKRVSNAGSYFPDLMLGEAKKFMAEQINEPFFLYYALNTPHWPYQADSHLVEQYQKEGVEYPRDLYAAFVTAQDMRIGALVNFLKEMKVLDNTIIIFQSDNGHGIEDRAHFGGGSSGIYRGAKRGLFEGGIRVPSIISWPGVIPENEIRGQMVHAIDWLPTLIELCGLDTTLIPEDIDGKSIIDIIRSSNSDSPHEILFWERTYRDQWVVRKGPWKLCANAFDDQRYMNEQDKHLFLANLDMDPGETNNLALEYPKIVLELQKLYETWSLNNETLKK